MERKNIIYTQFFEAIRFAQFDVFEYKRMCLILLDNIIEFLLKKKIESGHYSDKRKKRMTIDEYRTRIESLENNFENILNYAVRFDIIIEKEKPLLKYCHEARNSAYHGFSIDNKIVNFCNIILFDFLIKNIQRLLITDVGSNSDIINERHKYLIENSGFKFYSDIIKLAEKIIESSKLSSSEILSEVLIEQLSEIKDFYENIGDESWDEYNKKIRNQYFWNIEYKKEKKKKKETFNLKKSIIDYKKQWRDMSQEIFLEFQKKSNKIKTFPVIDVFEKFLHWDAVLKQHYLGINHYIAEQETIANNSDD